MVGAAISSAHKINGSCFQQWLFRLVVRGKGLKIQRCPGKPGKMSHIYFYLIILDSGNASSFLLGNGGEKISHQEAD